MNEKILLAESSPLFSEQISCALKNAGFEVTVFSDGKEAAYHALENKFSCIVSDVSLKTISGSQFCALVKSCPEYNFVPFVLFSAEEKQNDFWFENCGANSVVYLENNLSENLVEAVKNAVSVKAPATENVDIQNFQEERQEKTDLPVAAVHSMERINHYFALLNSIFNLTLYLKNIDALIKEIFSMIYSICKYDSLVIFINQEPVQCYYAGISSDVIEQEEKTGNSENSFYKICVNDFQTATSNFGNLLYDKKEVSEINGFERGEGARHFGSYMVFPVESSAVIGTVHVGSERNNFFDYLTVSTLEYFCSKIGFILEEAVEYKKSVFIQGRLRSAFSKYVPDEIIDELLKSESTEKQAANEKRKVAILICDIRNFTTISEVNQPENVVSFLNGYFSRMVDVIKTHGGSIDKFMGDAIMAIFGAPISYVDNAKRAVDAALEMVSIIPEIPCSLLQFPEGMKFDIGIGIHYGEVIVGNIGCKDKTDYTVIGDSANLASRLEGLTKQYGARIIISQAVRNELDEGYNLLQVDTVKVKGKKLGVQVYRSDLKPLDKEYIQLYEKGLSLYINGAFNLAAPYFEQALEIFPVDRAATLMKNRCIEFSAVPPENWDGAISLTSK